MLDSETFIYPLFLYNSLIFNCTITLKNHKRDREYQVWEEGAHPQLLQNQNILLQKLDYIHFNPVKRGYVDKPEDWRYSSARNYAGLEGLIDVYRQWV